MVVNMMNVADPGEAMSSSSVSPSLTDDGLFNESLLFLWNSSDKQFARRDPQLVSIGLAALALTFVFSVVGYTLIYARLGWLTWVRRPRKKLGRMNIMILHLSVADLFVAFFNVLPQIGLLITFRFHGNNFLCKTVLYLQVAAMYASSYVLLTTAVDRYLAICHPLRFRVSANCQIHWRVALAWAVAFLFASPQLVIFGMRWSDRFADNDCKASFEPAWTGRLYIIWFSLAVYIAPFTVLSVLYVRVCYVVWRSGRTTASGRWHLVPTTEARQRRQGQRCRRYSQQNSASSSPNQHHEDSNGQRMFPNADITTTALTNEMVLTMDSRCLPSRSEYDANEGRRTGVERGRPVLSSTKVKTAKFTATVIASYLICWGVYFVSLLYVEFVDVTVIHSASYLLVTMLLAGLSSAINPWIFMLFNGYHLLYPCRVVAASLRGITRQRSTLTSSSTVNSRGNST